MLSTIPVHDGPRSAWLDRAVAAGVFAAAVVCVVALLAIEPDPRGHATHTQWGMQECGWPKAYGLPCPACGATTAAALVVRGRLLPAVLVQPFGAAFALTGLALGAVAGYCLVRSRSFFDLWMQLPRQQIALAGVVLLVLAWGYKCIGFEVA